MLSQGQMRANAKRISASAALPEFDNARAESGVAWLYIEDQVQPRDVDISLAGKEVVSREVFCSRRLAAVKVRNRIKSDIVIIAQTNAFQTDGYNEVIQRLREAHEAVCWRSFFM